ncbi:MAG: 4Fe-4S binding protein [Alphaproteobacteria bacterium]
MYCSVLCPLGLYQEFLMLLFRRAPDSDQTAPTNISLPLWFSAP